MKLAPLIAASLALASPALATANGEDLAVNYNGEVHGWDSAVDADEAPRRAPFPPALAIEDGEDLAVNYNGEIHGWGSATDTEVAP